MNNVLEMFYKMAGKNNLLFWEHRLGIKILYRPAEYCIFVLKPRAY
jgi:hypothetical protein